MIIGGMILWLRHYDLYTIVGVTKLHFLTAETLFYIMLVRLYVSCVAKVHFFTAEPLFYTMVIRLYEVVLQRLCNFHWLGARKFF